MNQEFTDSIFKELDIDPTGEFGSYSSPSTAVGSITYKLISYNPATNEELGKVFLCDDLQYDKIIENSIAAFDTWKKVPAPKRGDIIRQIGDELKQHKERLGALISLEMGKIKQEGLGEVQEMIDMADFAVGQSRMLYGQTMHSERPEHRMFEQWHPLGVVGVITAFNFPMAVWAWNAFLAAVCGNVVVWKPSSKVPLCAIAIQKICNRVLINNNLPSIFNMFIPVDREVTEHFIMDGRVNLVSFTGSTKVGIDVGRQVAQRMGKSLLELGGNNAVIVTENANLELAIPAIVFGAVGTSGQRCTSTRRLFVHESKYAEVMKRLCKAYSQIKIGNPLEEGIHIGPLIDLDAVKNYQNKIDRLSRSLGKYVSEILQFGETDFLDGGCVNGCYVKPSIVEMMEHCVLNKDEIFAPILYVFKYSTLEEAIKLQNDVSQGLSSSIFTDNLQQAELFLSSSGSDCGIANVNIGTSGAEIGGAFGGEKKTGGGREAGSDAWKQYMRRQTNTVNWGNSLPLAQGIKFDI